MIARVEGCSLDGARRTIQEIKYQMKQAEVPEEFYQEVFRLVNEDYTIRRSHRD